MPEPSTPTIAVEQPLSGADSSYLVHGAVHEISGQAARIDGELLDKLIQRRLKRLERVLEAHGGTLLKPFPQGLLAAFHSAEAALIGACEMQRRCAVIPQLADTQLALKIGIHVTLGRRLSEQAPDPAEATAAKLSELLGESGIVISETVGAGLPSALKDQCAPIANDGSAIAAFSVDWNAVPMQRPPLPAANEPLATEKPAPPRNARIVLHQGTHSYSFDSRQHVITFGRDPASDVVVSSPQASRQHCRIIYRLGQYVLVDLSTNGTYVYLGDGQETRVQKSMLQLSGKGRVSFGQSWQSAAAQSFAFEVVTTG
ncbi:FHA domain-containing protein [Dechloromonas sp. XY25]|uniref:FHA domain-containing protein n=1 Tax=Dechloromonas hankyongensis TaxID=2908002 RepID=A0ABS9JYW8_9RHOO|nr:FHA domain-containing protein [Dechloromonas hankyongensis]MCG2576093.1 FHA domain-containing protein [Dechloromonas hankyongensis]